MPTYEYQCPEGHLFDKFQKMTEKPRARCPVCGKTAVRKISGGAGLVFKGSGFYITDYGKDGKGPRKAESDKPAESKPETAAKPEAKEAREAKADKATPPAPKADAKPTKAPSSRREGKAASE
jgi:putative FmdB family regulatory protein